MNTRPDKSNVHYLIAEAQVVCGPLAGVEHFVILLVDGDPGQGRALGPGTGVLEHLRRHVEAPAAQHLGGLLHVILAGSRQLPGGSPRACYADVFFIFLKILLQIFFKAWPAAALPGAAVAGGICGEEVLVNIRNWRCITIHLRR